MIKINGDIVTINKFPDGTPRINIDVNSIEEYDYDGSPCIWLDWYMKAMMSVLFNVDKETS